MAAAVGRQGQAGMGRRGIRNYGQTKLPAARPGWLRPDVALAGNFFFFVATWPDLAVIGQLRLPLGRTARSDHDWIWFRGNRQGHPTAADIIGGGLTSIFL